MAEKKNASKTINGNGKGRTTTKRDAAAGAFTQSPSHRPPGRERRTPSADELGRRAWETTYRNKHK